MKYLSIIVTLLVVSLQASDGGVVKDTQHHLQWQDNTQIDDKIWKMAKGYCSQLHLLGHNDWRLPTKGELLFLSKSPQLKDSFNHLQESLYWSNEEEPTEKLEVITVYSGNGFVSLSDKCEKYSTLCVRDDH